MNIREVSTARLREYENNPRNNDLAVEKVKYSIERFGFLFPVVVDMNYTIVAGHTRVRACRELGIQTVPCIIADELTDEQINLFRLVDNKTSEYSDWDFEKLKNELSLVDLTLDENQLLLERFELSAEVFDIEPEQAEIRVPAFNFMGANDKRKDKKTTVSTIQSDAEVDTNYGDTNLGEDVYKAHQESIDSTLEFESGSPAVGTENESDSPVVDTENEDETPSTNTELLAKKESRPPLPIYQFRFGSVAFFISKVELDRLNDKYTEYIDSESALKMSFANYLLKGVENGD